jgi:hypothetical protein
MDRPRQRPVRRSDLPLRLNTVPEPDGRFRYVILRKDGMTALTSFATFATEAEAKAAGRPVLRRRSLAAKLTPSRNQCGGPFCRST